MIVKDLISRIKDVAEQHGFKADQIDSLSVVDETITPINNVSWDGEEQVIVLS